MTSGNVFMRLLPHTAAILISIAQASFARDDAEQYYISEVESVVQFYCISCHRGGGQAGSTRLLFSSSAPENHRKFDAYVNSPDRGANADRLLQKIRGAAGHGGGTVLRTGSSEYGRFQAYVDLLTYDPGQVYTVTARSTGNGSVSPDGAQTVEEKTVLEFLLTPDSGYEIRTVAGSCGGDLTDSKFVTDPIISDCDVVADFRETEVQSLVVSPFAGAGGSISPSEPQSVSRGGTVEFDVTPNVDFELDTLSGSCDGTLTGITFTTNPVYEACDVLATFRPIKSSEYGEDRGADPEKVFLDLLQTVSGLGNVSETSEKAHDNARQVDRAIDRSTHTEAIPVMSKPFLFCSISLIAAIAYLRLRM